MASCFNDKTPKHPGGGRPVERNRAYSAILLCQLEKKNSHAGKRQRLQSSARCAEDVAAEKDLVTTLCAKRTSRNERKRGRPNSVNGVNSVQGLFPLRSLRPLRDAPGLAFCLKV